MNYLVAFLALVTSVGAFASATSQPIASGRYIFHHRFAEQPNMQLSPVVVKIAGRHITVISTTTADGFPKGIIAEGTLMWHPKTKEWIIGLEAGDRDAVEVGGCSGGPEVVDLKKRIFWTC